MYGNIVLCNTKTGFIPGAIKWFTGSLFSHSLIIIPNMLDCPMCIEAAEGGVDTCRFDTNYIKNENEGYEIWALNIDQSIKDEAIQSVLNDLEITYGFLQYPWFIWRRINKFLGRDIKAQNNWNTSGMICSQLCVAYLKACGLGILFMAYGNGAIAPQDLQDIMKAHPELFEKIDTVRL